MLNKSHDGILETEETFGKDAIFGHYYQRSMLPKRNNHHICVDTASDMYFS
jgi:hypothetical protein